MIRTAFLLIFLLCTIFTSNAQDKKVIASISKEICTCLESYGDIEDIGDMEIALENCAMKTSIKNMGVIKKELGIDMTQGEEAGRQFGEIIAYELVKKCNVFLRFITAISTDIEYENDSIGDDFEETSFLNPDLVPYEKYSTDSMSVSPKTCASYALSKYKYISENPTKNDYFILTKKECIEYHDNQKYASHYSIKWNKDCSFVATLVSSNSPEINNLLTIGDKVTYQIIGIYGETAYINIDFKGFSKSFRMLISKQ